MSTKWSSRALGKPGDADFGSLLKDEYAVVLLQGKNVFGDMVYCYLKVALSDIDRLKLALQTDASFNANDYGSVLAAGKGDPPVEVASEISQNHPVLEQPISLRPPSPPAVEKKAWDEF